MTCNASNGGIQLGRITLLRGSNWHQSESEALLLGYRALLKGGLAGSLLRWVLSDAVSASESGVGMTLDIWVTTRGVG